MANIIDLIDDYYPPNSGVSVPLRSQVTILFDRSMDEDSLEENFFIEGPDTDTFIGPGLEISIYPDSISQGEDFLTSPGYYGIIEGEFSFVRIDASNPDVTVTGEPYRTKMVFTPDNPMIALTQYTAHLPECEDSAGVTHSGHVIFSWTTGTGSIEYVPSTTSTSVLVPSSITLTAVDPTALEVVETDPADHEIQVDLETAQIIIDFNKELDEDSITDARVSVVATAATDHPKASATAVGDLAKTLEVSGKRLIIKI